MALFDDEGLKRIEAKVAEVEAKTAAEIVVVTAARSDGYRDVRLVLSWAGGFLAASVLDVVWHEVAPTWLLLFQALVSICLWPLSGVPAILRTFLPNARTATAVERAAELAFLEHEVFATRDRTGLVIYISELEHRVTLLGDSGIHNELTGEGFVPLVEHLVNAIREGRAAEGTCEVIERVGHVLAEHAPAHPDDNPNELENRVRVKH